MLYVTTRSKNEVYTAAVTLRHHLPADGGMFVPFRMPVMDAKAVAAMGTKSFGQNVADMLELFFSIKVSGWDVEMAIGRRCCLLKPINSRLQVAELFRNSSGDINRFIHILSTGIHPDGDLIGKPSEWSNVGVRIALLAGLMGELIRAGQARPDSPVNLAMAAGDFSGPMAAWYARQMGMPIGTIICGCNENGGPWELLHHGELDGSIAVQNTSTPECDYAIHPGLERLIHGACGQEEAVRYTWDIAEGGTYRPEPHIFDSLRQGMFAAVISRVRVETITPSVYHTARYVLSPYSALAYGALADFRARGGNGNPTVLLAEKSPLSQAQAVAKSMNISIAELRRRLTEV